MKGENEFKYPEELIDEDWKRIKRIEERFAYLEKEAFEKNKDLIEFYHGIVNT